MTKDKTPNPSDWLDYLASFNLHFGRFFRDIGGIFVLSIALISFLALPGWTHGKLIDPWIGFLKIWFGWGSYLVVVSIGVIGSLLLRRSDALPPLGRLITLEIAAFLALGLLTIIGGRPLSLAEQGFGGGRIGWGLDFFFSKLLSPFGSVLFFFFGTLLALMSGLNLWQALEDRLARIVEKKPEEVEEIFPKEEPAESRKKKRPKKERVKLPPEFRKSFSAQAGEDERPANPPPRDERLPPLTILREERRSRLDERTINQTAGLIEKTLDEFGIPAKVIGFRVGPAITQFAIQPGFIDKSSREDEEQLMKVRVSQIASLRKDLALALSAERLRIEAPVPGRPFVGIEVPNARVEVVRLRSILESEAFHKVRSPLAIAMGRDVSGHPVVADLGTMPHLLIAGATGSGKSVCITSLATSLAMNNAPEDLRMVMIDAKMVELIRFNGLPHLYGKVETDTERIQGVLRWVVVEMEQRYKQLEKENSRDIKSYNRKVTRRKNGVAMPRIVVFIDEMADLMMHAPDQTEHNLVRLAQMARATGIHLVMATQRPSTDVVTGLIKANFPARIAFAVTSGVDSRVVLDSVGAENLLGNGDMLYLSPEAGSPSRLQGVMITDAEIDKVISYWQDESPRTEKMPPWEEIVNEEEDEDESLIEQGIEVIRQSQRASASLLQRRLKVGYPRAARLLDSLEEMGVVGPSLGGGRERDVLIAPEDE